MPKKKRLLAIIGGTAKLEPPAANVRSASVRKTPFGLASSVPSYWALPGGERAVFLNRHGDFHQHNPTQINYPANFWLLKKLGVTDVLSLSAVGSLMIDIAPGLTVVIPDQFIDLTHRLQRTFFEDIAVHIGLGDPFCPQLREMCVLPVADHAAAFCSQGTYITIEGPQFSTRAESLFYANVMNGHVIGMTMATEARLAREAGLCFAGLALPADFDAWRTDKECANADMIKATLKKFEENLILIVSAFITRFYAAARQPCACANALKGMAVHTRMEEFFKTLPVKRREELLRKYQIFGIL